MKIVLLVAAGVVLGVVVLAALALGFLRKKIGNFCEAISELVQAGGIPPFRVHLEANPSPEWRDADGMAQTTGRFEAEGYAHIGDFDIREMDEVILRALWHRESGVSVAIYDHPESGMWVDAFQEFADGTSVTVTTAPETGMDRPLHSRLFRVDAGIDDDDLASQLHGRLIHEAIGLEANPIAPTDFADVYSELYAQEMDWRIARGGVTRAEIERVAEISGNEPPSEATIELIQDMWRGAMTCFIDDEVRDAWLADCDLSALEWERVQDRIYVVHDHHKAEDLIETLAWNMVEADTDKDADYDDEAAAEASRETLRPCFSVSNREGFGRAQAFLPEKQQYQKLGSTEDPWPADIWVAPELID